MLGYRGLVRVCCCSGLACGTTADPQERRCCTRTCVRTVELLELQLRRLCHLFSGQVPDAARAPRVAVRRELELPDKVLLGKQALEFKSNSEDDKAWRRNFVLSKWGRGLDNKDM